MARKNNNKHLIQFTLPYAYINALEENANKSKGESVSQVAKRIVMEFLYTAVEFDEKTYEEQQKMIEILKTKWVKDI